MELYIIAGLLFVMLCALVWIGTRLTAGKDTSEVDSILLLQRETEAMRRELQTSIQASVATVNQSLQNNLSSVNEQLARTTSLVSGQLNAMNTQMQTSTGQINDRMDNAAKVVGEVKRSLGELGQATKQVFDVGKDIASLQEILKAPKLRGELGEFFLGDLLAQILPSANFALQHSFKNGTRVDAVIKLSNGLVPVDSKFPLENFRKFLDAPTDKEKLAAKRGFIKDVKNRIDEIATSYIQPDDGTFNFALMYIPAENVYYETIIKDDAFGDERQIATYAFSKRVIPVSPNSFYAYLQTILLGLRGLEISKQAQSILTHLTALTNDFGQFSDDFEVLGKHLVNARTKHEDAQKKLDRFGEKLSSFSDVGSEACEAGEASEARQELEDTGAGKKLFP